MAVFSASGGSAGVAKRLDVFGVVLAGCVAALGGGILRDIVINQSPPLRVRRLALRHWSAPIARQR